jgi:hypothetical protein
VDRAQQVFQFEVDWDWFYSFTIVLNGLRHVDQSTKANPDRH